MAVVCLAKVFLSILAFSAWAQSQVATAFQGTPGSTSSVPIPAATEKRPAASPRGAAPEVKLSREEMETFLKTAPIVSQKVLGSGTTGSIKATLSDGKITHDVHIQTIDVYKPVFKGAEGTVEKNFRDTYKFNIAAYRVARLIGIDSMVPMSVEREINGKYGSVTWWVDDVWITEAERRDKKIKPPATQEWSDQLNVIRVFDQLIYNTDRNQGNLLITPQWKIYMIDHTRAFRPHKTLLKPESLGRCDYNLLQALRKLDPEKVAEELRPYLRAEEIAGLMARRDVIVDHFEREISAKGQDAVLTGIPRKTPSVTIP